MHENVAFVSLVREQGQLRAFSMTTPALGLSIVSPGSTLRRDDRAAPSAGE